VFIKSVTGLKVVPSWWKASTDARLSEGSAVTRSSLLTAWTGYSGSSLNSKSGSSSLHEEPDEVEEGEEILQDDDNEFEDEDDDD
jgi:hypothetical protein